ncbi:MAG: hypothetical protein E7346_03605 [Clostridiales bacterium]|nr:hypothetical protein [Clostridiales bacterium]
MNTNVLNCSKWIWSEEECRIDDRAEFLGTLNITNKESIICRVSCDSDYALYINGKFVSSNQYGDFPHYKVYDEIDVSEYLEIGINHVFFSVWYFGVGSQKYFPSNAGIIFEFTQGDKKLLISDEKILARQSKTYACGRAKNVSCQLGMSFLYDISAEDQAKIGEIKNFSQAICVSKNCEFYPRPNKKLCYGSVVKPASVSVLHDGRSILVDLGKETVGLATLKLYSPKRQRITVVFGEKIVSGNVPRFIGGNDYSFEIITREGENEFFDPFLRIGCRYLQVFAEEKIDLTILSLIPVYYPFTQKRKISLSKLDSKIYDLCVDTLNLCALEHYVDCPFREQGLYAFDSRNQMLSGYYAFEGYDYFEYAKSNLLLFSQDRRKDSLLTITAPSDTELVIPSFSLYYVISVCEYLIYSKDTVLDQSIIDKITAIMNGFASRIKDGLVRNILNNDMYWNFYDWSDGAAYCKEESDIFANCLYLLATKAYKNICEIISIDVSFDLKENEIKKQILANFFDEKEGLFSISNNNKIFTQLGNSLAVLSGVVDKETANDIIKKIIDGKTAESSLSTKVFFYDAMLLTDKDKYENIILEEIRGNYGFMLKNGATATWETLEGPNAFDGAGSLCHGWSAIPIYYYNVLKH